MGIKDILLAFNNYHPGFMPGFMEKKKNILNFRIIFHMFSDQFKIRIYLKLTLYHGWVLF